MTNVGRSEGCPALTHTKGVSLQPLCGVVALYNPTSQVFGREMGQFKVGRPGQLVPDSLGVASCLRGPPPPFLQKGTQVPGGKIISPRWPQRETGQTRHSKGKARAVLGGHQSVPIPEAKSLGELTRAPS